MTSVPSKRAVFERYLNPAEAERFRATLSRMRRNYETEHPAPKQERAREDGGAGNVINLADWRRRRETAKRMR